MKIPNIIVGCFVVLLFDEIWNITHNSDILVNKAEATQVWSSTD